MVWFKRASLRDDKFKDFQVEIWKTKKPSQIASRLFGFSRKPYKCGFQLCSFLCADPSCHQKAAGAVKIRSWYCQFHWGGHGGAPVWCQLPEWPWTTWAGVSDPAGSPDSSGHTEQPALGCDISDRSVVSGGGEVFSTSEDLMTLRLSVVSRINSARRWRKDAPSHSEIHFLGLLNVRFKLTRQPRQTHVASLARRLPSIFGVLNQQT